MRDPGVDDNAIAHSEGSGASAESCDDAGSVRTENAWLGHRRHALPNPDVEVVEACGSQRDENLARSGLGIGDVLVAEDIGAAVLVDADRLHGAESSHDQR